MRVDWDATRAKYKGRFCCGGIDLSAVDDLTCCAYLFPHLDDRRWVDILLRTWCPEVKIHAKDNRYRDQYQAWERQGWLAATEGNAIDYDLIRAEIEADARFFKMALIGIDRQFQGVEFSMKLADALGHTENKPVVITCTNQPTKIGPVCQEFERRLLEKKLNHGGNPILRFMADNVSVTQDHDGNQKPSKAQSQGKIDGIMGVLYGLDRLMKSKPPSKVKMPVAI